MSDSTTEWDTAAAAVAEHADRLRAATTHREIRAWADEAKVTGKRMWPKVKTELRKQLDIDYDALRTATTDREAAEVSAAAALLDVPAIELYAAGDAECDSFAVVAVGDERDSWYGDFHPKDTIYRGDDLTAELSAADKAVYLAGRARDAQGLDAVKLHLFISHPDVDTTALAATAARNRVAVEVEVTDMNPAVAMCRAPGYRQWREVKLTSLFAPREPDSGAA